MIVAPNPLNTRMSASDELGHWHIMFGLISRVANALIKSSLYPILSPSCSIINGRGAISCNVILSLNGHGSNLAGTARLNDSVASGTTVNCLALNVGVRRKISSISLLYIKLRRLAGVSSYSLYVT